MDRDEFNKAVFERDDGECVLCGDDAVDAHHVMERKLFEDGGYVLANGASVCSDCHWKCEITLVHPEEVRKVAGIEDRVLPDSFDPGQDYDKWGNVITHEEDALGREIFFRGPLFESAFQRVLEYLPDEVKCWRVYI